MIKKIEKNCLIQLFSLIDIWKI